MDSSTVFDLRREAKALTGHLKTNKLNYALGIANNLIRLEPNNEWNQKALAWVLIDLCKYYLDINQLNSAKDFWNKLSTIEFAYEDEIIEGQKLQLQRKVDSSYDKVKAAEELSRAGKYQEAINIFQNLINQGALSEIHHESYGWAIYRYIKNSEGSLSSIQIKRFLVSYISLDNERPSLLHSMILNFALSYAKSNLDLNLYEFFKLWDPRHLRYDDKSVQIFEGNNIPSLISRIFKFFVEADFDIDISYLIENISISTRYDDSNKIQVLDLLREPIFLADL